MKKIFYIITNTMAESFGSTKTDIQFYEDKIRFEYDLKAKIKESNKIAKELNYITKDKIRINKDVFNPDGEEFKTSISWYLDSYYDKYHIDIEYGYKRYGQPDAIDRLFYNIKDDETGTIELEDGAEIKNSEELMDYMFATLESNMQYDFGNRYAFDRDDTIQFCKAVIKRLEAEENA